MHFKNLPQRPRIVSRGCRQTPLSRMPGIIAPGLRSGDL
ncbi:hypothetical protein CSIRO_0579 [Bradyrhizobiaceae bacterium SG-6C]|nr:hypothetical protein CSIRO_0579 [Bradyrhizobiaceae bacterium SG-6C]